MAANAAKTPLIRLLAKRHFASAKPAVNPSSNIQVTSLPNKLVVASADSVIPGIAKISVAFKAGSRYEKDDSEGASHVIRSSCGLTTKSASQFGITRNLQLLGAGLSATSCRETIVYTLETTCDHLDKALDYLKAVTSDQEFKPWELKDNVQRIKNELNSLPPQAVLFDLAHNAAYRKILGNSIFVKEHNISKLGSETLQHFVAENFRSDRGCVAGVGVSHDFLVEFANCLNLQSGPGDCATSKYYGGEVRKETAGDNAYVMLAAESSSLLKKEVFAWGVLAHALGGSAHVKYGAGSSPLSKSVGAVPTASAAAVHIPHSDSGLLAIAISSHGQHSGQAVEAVMKALKGGVSEGDVARGKAGLKADILSAADCSNSLLSELAYQGLLVGTVSTPTQLASAVDGVSLDQVQEVYKKFISGKKSLAALGNIRNTPFVDEL